MHSCCYHHINPKMGNDDSEGTIMEYSDIYVRRIRKLCKERHIAINKLATKHPRVKTLHKSALAFNMTLAEFLDFDELNDYSFDEGDDE